MMSPLRIPAASAPDLGLTFCISSPPLSFTSVKRRPKMTGRGPSIFLDLALMIPMLSLRLRLVVDPLVTTQVPCSIFVCSDQVMGFSSEASTLSMARSQTVSDASSVTLLYFVWSM